jgi:hypothetical protein
MGIVGQVGWIVAALAVAVGLVLLLRRVIWWYWGIDRALAHLRSIDTSLQQLPAVQAYRARLARERGRRAA